jgi:hypothetical protein
MRKTLLLIGLSFICASVLPTAGANAGAPTYNEGCVVHGWIASGSTLTPFDAIIQESAQYTTATGGNVLSGEEVVNIGGERVCTYVVVSGTSSTFTVNSAGILSASVTFTPGSGNPAGCATSKFVGTSQGIISASGSNTLITTLGETGSGLCSLQ